MILEYTIVLYLLKKSCHFIMKVVGPNSTASKMRMTSPSTDWHKKGLTFSWLSLILSYSIDFLDWSLTLRFCYILEYKHLTGCNFFLALHRVTPRIWSLIHFRVFHAICLRVGGRATPTALKRLEQVPWGAVLIAIFLLFESSNTTSCRAVRSRLISFHSRHSLDASSRFSSSFLSTSARKLQNTWPLIVSSSWW